MGSYLCSAVFSKDSAQALIDFALLVVTVVSVFFAFLAYRHQRNRSKKDAACGLAKHYAGSIIGHYSYISEVLTRSGIVAKTKACFPLTEIKDFDRDELDLFLSKQGMTADDFHGLISTIDPFIILNSAFIKEHSVLGRALIQEGYVTINKDTGERKISNPSLLQNDFMQEITDTLNELEWFSMNCMYGLADEEILYQSLHQSFLATVWMLYFFISFNNTDNADKYYTNTIWLFHQWRNRLSLIQKKAAAKKQKLERKIKDAKPIVYSGHRL